MFYLLRLTSSLARSFGASFTISGIVRFGLAVGERKVQTAFRLSGHPSPRNTKS